MKHKKTLVKVLACIAVIPAVIGSCSCHLSHSYASSEPTTEPVTTTNIEIYDKTRYQPWTPSFKDVISVVGQSIKMDIQESLKILEFLNPDVDGLVIDQSIEDALLNPDKGIGLTSAVKAQRAIDLKEYANLSTTGSIPDSFAFTAKRRLYYPNGLYETDTMYYWYSYDTNLHTPSNLEGVQIGDFFLQPNSFVVFRNFSNGDSSCFYGNALDFPLTTYTDKTTQYKVERQSGKTYSVINQDGVVESIAPANGYTYPPIIQFKSCGTDSNGEYINNITSQDLYIIANNYPSRFSPYMSTDRVFTNIECMMSNAYNSSGAPMLGKGYVYDRYFPAYVWYLSSGCYFGNDRINANTIDTVFNRDPENIDPVKAPIYYNLNDPLSNPQIPTQQTVNNYYDYGITYNTDDNQFDIDLDTLLGSLAPSIQPTLEPTFDGTFELQPDIGGSYSGTLDNNYIDLGNDYIIDLLQSLVPSSGSRPLVPAITTMQQWDLIPQYSTGTFPVAVHDGAEVISGTTTDFTDAMGITEILLLLALIGLLTYCIF